ncbi:hypothetical protein ACFV23_35415, partial [Streptomyces sp. NPDC059627]
TGADHGAGAGLDDSAAPVPPLRIEPRSAAGRSSRPDPAATVEKLMRDPSLRNSEQGKSMLRLLHINAVGAKQLPDAAETVPAHCVTIIVQLAQQYANMWQECARELDRRARIVDPFTTRAPTRSA